MNNKKNKSLSDWFDLTNKDYKNKKYIELPMLSGSMMPVLIPGKNIRIKSISQFEIRVGDIIIFKDGNTLTAHRVLIKLSVAGKTFIYQKGDTNRLGYWIAGEKIVGYVHSAQKNNNTYINLKSKKAIKKARKKALIEILKTIFNTLIILPKKINRWQKQIRMNSD